MRDAVTTEDPGVWIKDSARKVCAVGVQISRGVSSHGVGLNVVDQRIGGEGMGVYRMPMRDGEGKLEVGEGDVAPGYLSWGFARIVACGLQGKSVTWLEREAERAGAGGQGLTVDEVSETLAEEVARSLGDRKSTR